MYLCQGGFLPVWVCTLCGSHTGRAWDPRFCGNPIKQTSQLTNHFRLPSFCGNQMSQKFLPDSNDFVDLDHADSPLSWLQKHPLIPPMKDSLRISSPIHVPSQWLFSQRLYCPKDNPFFLGPKTYSIIYFSIWYLLFQRRSVWITLVINVSLFRNPLFLTVNCCDPSTKAVGGCLWLSVGVWGCVAAAGVRPWPAAPRSPAAPVGQPSLLCPGCSRRHIICNKFFFPHLSHLVFFARFLLLFWKSRPSFIYTFYAIMAIDLNFFRMIIYHFVLQSMILLIHLILFCRHQYTKWNRHPTLSWSSSN